MTRSIAARRASRLSQPLPPWQASPQRPSLNRPSAPRSRSAPEAGVHRQDLPGRRQGRRTRGSPAAQDRRDDHQAGARRGRKAASAPTAACCRTATRTTCGTTPWTPSSGTPATTTARICYARSKDGIHWDKPDAGLVEYRGNRQNNIVFGPRGGRRNPRPGRRHGLPRPQRARRTSGSAWWCRFGVQSEHGGMHVFSSGDGIHWKLTHPSVVTARPEEKRSHLDSQNVIFWDDAAQEVRRLRPLQPPGAPGAGAAISRGESDHLGGFPVVQDMPVVFQPDDDDLMEDELPVVDFYMSAAVKYPWADNAYFMFPTAYYHYTGRLPEFTKECPANAGPLDTQFAASRDGINWERYDRRPFVPLGMKGEFDWGCARVVWGLVPDTTGREMYIYYRGSDWLHGWDRDERNKRLLTEAGLGASQNIAVLSRVVSRRDGFISVRAAYTGGEFTTPPLVFEGKQLVLNVDTSATGMARVGILDADGKPIEGFSVEQCDLIHTCNEINRTVSLARQQRRAHPGRQTGAAAVQHARLRSVRVPVSEHRQNRRCPVNKQESEPCHHFA